MKLSFNSEIFKHLCGSDLSFLKAESMELPCMHSQPAQAVALAAQPVRPVFAAPLVGRAGPPQIVAVGVAPGPFQRGARMTMPSWTVGHAFAMERLGGLHVPIVGYFVALLAGKKGFGNCVWEDGDAPAEQETRMSLVSWDNAQPQTPSILDASGELTLHNAKQAYFMAHRNLCADVKRGRSACGSSLYRAIELGVTSIEEFHALFESVSDLLTVREVKSPKPLDTYLGEVAIDKKYYVHAFPSLRRWAGFVGDRACFATPDCPDPMNNVLAAPVAVLSIGATFSLLSLATLCACGLKPLLLTRALPGVAMRHPAMQSAVANARDIEIYILDLVVTASETFAYVFVRSGHGPAGEPDELREIYGTNLLGCFGHVPLSFLSWNSPVVSVVSVVFCDIRSKACCTPFRRVHCAPTPTIKFRPILVVAASGS